MTNGYVNTLQKAVGVQEDVYSCPYLIEEVYYKQIRNYVQYCNSLKC